MLNIVYQVPIKIGTWNCDGLLLILAVLLIQNKEQWSDDWWKHLI